MLALQLTAYRRSPCWYKNPILCTPALLLLVFFIQSVQEMGTNEVSCDRLLGTKSPKISFKTVSLPSCLLCLATTLAHPMS